MLHVQFASLTLIYTSRCSSPSVFRSAPCSLHTLYICNGLKSSERKFFHLLHFEISLFVNFELSSYICFLEICLNEKRESYHSSFLWMPYLSFNICSKGKDKMFASVMFYVLSGNSFVQVKKPPKSCARKPYQLEGIIQNRATPWRLTHCLSCSVSTFEQHQVLAF